MTDGRITQAAALVAASGTPDADVTQAAALVLGAIIPESRVTQLALLVLGVDLPGARITQGLALILAEEPPAATGYDLLTEAPSGETDHVETVARSFAFLDPGLGLATGDAREVAPRPARPFVWIAFGWPAVATLRAFLEARRGRVRPFWLPAWEHSLALASDGAPGDPWILIHAVGYAARIWPVTGARRHLLLRQLGGGGTPQLRTVTAAVDNGDGTELLTLSAALDVAIGMATHRVEFLKLSRLDASDVALEWLSANVAQATIPTREVPLEAPLGVVFP